MKKTNSQLIEGGAFCSLGRRIYGGFIDGLILIPFSLLIEGLVYWFSLSEIMKSSAYNILTLVYATYFLASKKQAPLGYYLAGIRFSCVNGNRISLSKAIWVSLVYLSVSYCITWLTEYFLGAESYEIKWALVSILVVSAVIISPYFLTKKKQLLHDILSGTCALKDVELENQVEDDETNTVEEIVC